MREKEGIVKFVKIVRKAFIVFSILAIPAMMVCLVYAFSGAMAFWIITPVAVVLYLVLYGMYALKVSMGTVIGMEVTEQVIHLKTRRRTYTYDAKRGCVAMRVKKNKFIAVFETQDSRDSYTFYRRVWFSPYSEEQFTEEEMRLIFPAME